MTGVAPLVADMVAATCCAAGGATKVAGMAAKTYSVSKLAELTGMSPAGIKKAIAEKRVRAHKRNGAWAIDPTDPQVQEWIHKDSGNVVAARDELLDEVNRLRRENANLAKRVRQAEAAQRRAERKARQLEAELNECYREASEQARQDADKIYRLSHEVIEEASRENARTLLKVVSMLADVGPERQVLPGRLAEDEAPSISEC